MDSSDRPKPAGRRPALRSAAVPAALFSGTGPVVERTRGRLPHREGPGRIYFVTFRLFDSIPEEVARRIAAERLDILATARQMRRDLTEAERERLARLFSHRVETWLDRGIGSCYLQRPQIAAVVASALRHFDQQRYLLLAWCLMPNHVHVVFQSLGNEGLAEVLHTWKSFTAHEANRILRRKGDFWQREYYDRIVRDPVELDRIVRYVANNPLKAGLNNWSWVEVL